MPPVLGAVIELRSHGRLWASPALIYYNRRGRGRQAFMTRAAKLSKSAPPYLCPAVPPGLGCDACLHTAEGALPGVTPRRPSRSVMRRISLGASGQGRLVLFRAFISLFFLAFPSLHRLWHVLFSALSSSSFLYFILLRFISSVFLSLVRHCHSYPYPAFAFPSSLSSPLSPFIPSSLKINGIWQTIFHLETDPTNKCMCMCACMSGCVFLSARAHRYI